MRKSIEKEKHENNEFVFGLVATSFLVVFYYLISVIQASIGL